MKITKDNNFKLIVFISIWVALLSVFVADAHCQTVTGNVIKWFDGDTVQFRQSNGKYYRVRLQGIDAPERRQTEGIECTNQLRGFTEKKTVSLTIYGDDTYKRKLGKLSTETIADVNLKMIEIGCAWEYSAPLSVKTAYQNAEQTARFNQIGLWAEENPTTPWAFRSNSYGTP